MTKKTTRIICIILAALMVLGIVAIVIPTYAVTQAEIDELTKQRDTVKAKQDDIQEQIDTLKAEMASVMERKKALEDQIALTMEDIALLDEQIALYDEMISEKADEVDDAIEAEETQLMRYKARVRAMEESNTWTYISILLQATSLTDFLGRLNDVADILRNDKNIRAEYVAAREYLQEVKAEYEEIQSQQEATREELKADEALLEQQTEQAAALIEQLADDMEAYEAAYEETEAEKDEIQALIDAKVEELRKKEEEERKAREAYEAYLRAQQAAANSNKNNSSGNNNTTGGNSGGTTAAAGAGYYIWPANSTYITSRWGWRVHPLTGANKYHAGVDIGASNGSAVAAAAGGTVQIAEYSSSYGNYCVIYHSNGTTTLYAHMNALPVVSVGSTVTAGQTIGYVGSTGWATGPHLHFEVRVNGSTVDPLSYFPNTAFSYAPDA